MQIFRTPFTRGYWKTASLELKNTRMLALAALVVAMRVALRSARIPVAENLYISIAFLPNALGSMLYGPFVALIAGFVTDTLGALLFPVGAYFPPFALVEMLGSFIFAIFLYKAPLSIGRVAISKLLINLLCNILLTPLFLAWMNGRAAVLMSMPRIAKNVCLFPLETLLLCVFLGAMLPILRRMGLTKIEQTALKLSSRHYIMLGALFIVSVTAVALYWRIFL